MKAVPADLNLIAQVQWVIGCCAILKVTDIEGGERVVDEAVHGPILTVHVEVHQARDEVRREGDHKGLPGKRSEHGSSMRQGMAGQGSHMSERSGCSCPIL